MAKPSGWQWPAIRYSLYAIISMAVWACAIEAASPTVTAPLPTAPPPQVQITFAGTPTPDPALAPIPKTTLTATPDPACALYIADSHLLTPIVDRDSALTADYEPLDLETPSLAYRNSYIVPIRIRAEVIQPLKDMLGEANEFGLQIMAVSGYRSYEEQAVAYEKWKRLYPDRADTISAAPGHSEHQLGAAIDFSAPFMEEQYGQLFHTDFFKIDEGRWLYDNSPRFGFTLSYPAWAEQTTGYQWEPWHFRYVGVELAQELVSRKITLAEYLAQCAPAP
ncbi:MAG: M15 family metallopeptidase [Chloroflexi bacterium]|nr:M15 family metallopeptidase [Chloroflexota bacterium]